MNIFSRVASFFQTKTNPEWNNLSVYSDVPQAIRMSNNFKTYCKEGYKNSDTLYKCISYLIRNAAAIPPVLYTDEGMTKQIKKHAILDKLNRPNIEQSGVAYRETVLGYKYLAGNSFQYAIRAKNGPPDELWALRPDRMEILAVPSKGIVGYKHENIDGPILPQNIGHLKYWNPDDDDQKGMGMSPVQAAALNIDMQIAGKKYNLGLMQNGARPSGIWKIPALMGFNERKQLEQKLHDTYSGATRAGKSPLLDGGLDWKPTGLPPAQMEWLDSLKYNGGSIANILNMPPQLIGDTSSTTYDNMEQAKAASYTEEIFPTLDDFYALLRWWLVPMYPGLAESGAYLYYDKQSVEVVQKLIQAQKDAQAARANSMWMDGLGTLNECRDFCGLPSLGTDGDVFRFGAVLVKKSELGKYAEQSLAEPAAPPKVVPEPLNVPGLPGQPPSPDQKPQAPNDNPPSNSNDNPPNNADKQPSKRYTWRKDKADDDEEVHTGVMIALFLDRKTAKKLAIPDGEPVNDLHITLAFLGDKNEIELDIPALKKLVAGYASEAAPLKGTTSGIGRFSPSDSSDGLVPIYASVNVSGIQAFRSDLVKQLETEDIEIANDFEYMPHITLAYVDEDEASPVDSIPTLKLAFDQLWLCIGDDRYSFPIGDEQYPSKHVQVIDQSNDEDKINHISRYEYRKFMEEVLA